MQYRYMYLNPHQYQQMVQMSKIQTIVYSKIINKKTSLRSSSNCVGHSCIKLSTSGIGLKEYYYYYFNINVVVVVVF
jgi:hypothetical protein